MIVTKTDMATIAERRKFILDNINEKGFVKVAELARAMEVTQTTIRKDLTFLEKQGALYRAYGSAMSSSAPLRDVNINTKRLAHFAEKQRIAKAAVRLVKENDSIIIAAGSTMAVFAENIRPKGRLNVVTPSVNIAMLLSDMVGVTVMQLGGIIYGNSMCVVGSDVIAQLHNLHCSTLFFGVDGIDPEFGATCATPEEAALTHRMMEISDKVVLLADSSKVGFCAFGHICDASEIDLLITDGGIGAEQEKALSDKGIKVMKV